jgi:hypothetical protein
VEHTAVVRALVAARAILFFKNANGGARLAEKQLPGNSQSNNAATDNEKIWIFQYHLNQVKPAAFLAQKTTFCTTFCKNDIAFFNLEAHILERPEIIRRGHAIRGFFKDRSMWIRSPELARDPALDLVDQHLAVDDPKAVFFRKIFYSDDGWHGRGNAERLKTER